MRFALIILTCLYTIAASAQFAPGPFQRGFYTGGIANCGSGGAAPACMSAPLMNTATTAASASTSATYYQPLLAQGYQIPWSNNIAVGSPMPMAGTISHTQCALNGASALTSGSYTVTLLKNQVATSIVCGPMTASATSSASNALTDTTHTVSFNAGDILSWKSVPSSPSSGQAPAMGVEFTDNTPVGNEAPLCVTTSNTAEVFGDYYWNGGTATTSTEVTASLKFPVAGTIDDLYINRSGATAGQVSYTIYHNGSSTSLVATTNGSTTTASDTNPAHAITIADGDTISVTPANVSGGSVSQMSACVRWQPTVAGQYVLGGSIGSGINSAGKRAAMLGGNTGNGTFTAGASLSIPFAYGAGWCSSQCMTFTDFFSAATSAPTSLTFTVTDYTSSSGSSNLKQNITTTNGGTGSGAPTLCSCSVTVTNSASSTTFNAADMFDVVGNPASGTVSLEKWGMVVTVP